MGVVADLVGMVLIYVEVAVEAEQWMDVSTWVIFLCILCYNITMNQSRKLTSIMNSLSHNNCVNTSKELYHHQ